MIPGSWQTSTIGELCQMVKGQAPIMKTKPGPYPLVTMGEEHKTADSYQFDAEAICVPMISSFGHGRSGLKRVHYIEGKFALSNILMALSVNDPSKLSTRFLGLYLQTFKDQLIVPLQTGAANMSLSPERLATVPVSFPPVDEQSRIMRLLDEADALRRLRARADERMAEFIPALFHEMFGDPARNEKGWPTASLGKVLIAVDSGRSPVCLDRQAGVDEWGVLKLGAVTSGVYLDTENKALPEGIMPDPELEVKEKDVLFSRKNTYDLIAACVLVWKTRPKLMLSDLTFRLSISPESKVLPEYLWATLSNRGKRKQIQRLASGTAANMPNISKERLKTVEILVPPFPLQYEFAARMASFDKLKTLQAQSQARLDALFESMLAQAFAGEL